jgi:hypothetical protein
MIPTPPPLLQWMMATSNSDKVRLGFRSGLEETVAAQLAAAGIRVSYEPFKVAYTKPVKTHKYSPDFVLPNGIIVETKGRFLTADRQKHKLIKEQYPALDIRFVFSRSATKLTKSSPTTYAAWSTQYGFKYADKLVPQVWLNEINCPKRWAAIIAATGK